MDWVEGRPTLRSVGTKRPKRWPMLDSVTVLQAL